MVILKPPAPFLESGDRLTRAEFHRRYLARPDIKRAELIDGVVYVPSPTRWSYHDDQATAMVAWVAAYAARHHGVHAGSTATLFLEGDNEVQPDAFLFKVDADGPGARVNEQGYIEGAPQLVVEVAASTVSYDLHDKMDVYRRNGVHEYIVWRVLDAMIDWYRLRGDEYEWVEPDDDGVIASAVFHGLRLHVPKLLAGDVAGVLAELDRA